MTKRKKNIARRFIANKEFSIDVKKEADVSESGCLAYVMHNIYSNTRDVLVTKQNIVELDTILEQQLFLLFKHSSFGENALSAIILDYLQHVTCGSKKEKELHQALALLMHVFIIKNGEAELPNKRNPWLRKAIHEIVGLCYRGMCEDCIIYFLKATKDYTTLLKTWHRLTDSMAYYKDGTLLKTGNRLDEALDAQAEIAEVMAALSQVELSVNCNRKYLGNLIRNIKEHYSKYLALRNHIITAYLKLAVKTVVRMKGAIPPKLTTDAIQEASISILQAIRAYQPKSTTSMSSFVIKKATEYIVNNILYRINLIKMPEGIQKNISAFERAKKTKDRAENVAADTGLPVSSVEHTLKNMVVVDSIHTTDGEDAFDVAQTSTTDKTDPVYAKRIFAVRNFVENYSPLVKRIVGLKYGLSTLMRDKQAEQQAKENFNDISEILRQIVACISEKSASCKEEPVVKRRGRQDSLLTADLIKTLQL